MNETKTVYISFPLNEQQKKRFESISERYHIVYENDPDADIVLGYPSVTKLKNYRHLKWLQSQSVGVDRFIAKGVLNEDTILTNAVDIHTKEVAEHLLATLLMMIKNLHIYRDYQHRHLWKDAGKTKELGKLRVTILGLGHIGRHLARLLKTLGVYVIGVKRDISEILDCVDELYSNTEMEKAISDSDAVISILPGNKENEGLFTVDTFRKMRKDCIFINAGRGNLYSEETLKTVLNEKIIAAVAADVFEKEPLDENSELWDQKDLFITPHAAGGYHLDSAFEDLLDLCEDNLRRYANGEPLRNIVSERE